MEGEVVRVGIGGAFCEVGDWAALSRRFCWDFVLPRPNAWRLDASKRLADCKGLRRDVVLTAHLLIAASRSGVKIAAGEGLEAAK